MIGTGLKKCIPMTFSGFPDAEAISDIDSEDVFVAKIQSSFVSKASTWNILALISRTSGTASITRSTSETASTMSLTAVKFACHSAFCSAVVFPRAIPLSQNSLMVFMPRSNPSG